MQTVTCSQLKTFRACPRLHQYQYVQLVRPVHQEAPLRFGSLMHAMLEAWWKTPSREPAGDLRLDAALSVLDGLLLEPFERARLEIAMRGYDARWSGEPLVVLAVEREFTAPVVNPATAQPSRTFQLGGKLDVVVRDARSLVMLVEHKTSSEDISSGSEYWRALALDAQISTYYPGARALGFDVHGCIYDVIKRPAQMPLKATPIESRKYKKGTTILYANQREHDETPDEFGIRIAEAICEDPSKYYARGEVVRIGDDEIEAAADTWQQTRALREAQLSNRWPRNPDACRRYNRTCSFFDVCTRVTTIDDSSRFRRAERRHEELSTKEECI